MSALGCHNLGMPDRDAMDAILLVLRTGMQQWELTRLCVAAHNRAGKLQPPRSPGGFTALQTTRPGPDAPL
jgi:hypothetical protein